MRNWGRASTGWSFGYHARQYMWWRWKRVKVEGCVRLLTLWIDIGSFCNSYVIPEERTSNVDQRTQAYNSRCVVLNKHTLDNSEKAELVIRIRICFHFNLSTENSWLEYLSHYIHHFSKLLMEMHRGVL